MRRAYLRAEARKFLTLRSTWIGLGVGGFGSLALTVLNALTVRQALTAGEVANLASTSPFDTAQSAPAITVTVLAVVWGAASSGAEYAPEQVDGPGGRGITTTLLALPHRRRLLTTKALLAAGAAAVVGMLILVACWATARGLLPAAAETVPTGQALARVARSGWYWAGMAVIALALTALARSEVVPLVLLVVNSSLVSVSLLAIRVLPAARWLPDAAARNLFGLEADELGGPGPLAGGLALGAWALGLLALAAFVLDRRDA